MPDCRSVRGKWGRLLPVLTSKRIKGGLKKVARCNSILPCIDYVDHRKPGVTVIPHDDSSYVYAPLQDGIMASPRQNTQSAPPNDQMLSLLTSGYGE